MSSFTTRRLHAEDEAITRAFLQEHISSSMFLLSNLLRAGFEYHGDAFQGIYIGCFERTQLIGVLAYYWNGNIIHQMPNTTCIPSALDCLATINDAPIQGILGPQEQAGVVIAHLGLTKDDMELDDCEWLYELDINELIVPEHLSNDTITTRHAEPSELELLTAWRLAYCIEALAKTDNEETRAYARGSIQRTFDKNDLFVLLHHDQLVSMSAFNARVPKYNQIGGVYTPPEHRKKGYAQALVAAQLQWAQKHRLDIVSILYTDQDNIPAQRVYTKIGFRCIGEYALITLA